MEDSIFLRPYDLSIGLKADRTLMVNIRIVKKTKKGGFSHKMTLNY